MELRAATGGVTWPLLSRIRACSGRGVRTAGGAACKPAPLSCGGLTAGRAVRAEINGAGGAGAATMNAALANKKQVTNNERMKVFKERLSQALRQRLRPPPASIGIWPPPPPEGIERAADMLGILGADMRGADGMLGMLGALMRGADTLGILGALG